MISCKWFNVVRHVTTISWMLLLADGKVVVKHRAPGSFYCPAPFGFWSISTCLHITFPLQEQNQHCPGHNYVKQLKMPLFKDSAAGMSMRVRIPLHLKHSCSCQVSRFCPFVVRSWNSFLWFGAWVRSSVKGVCVEWLCCGWVAAMSLERVWM